MHNALEARNRELEQKSLMKYAVARQYRRERNARLRLKLGSAFIAIGTRIHGAADPCPQPEPATA
jgi:hypothetical protein